MLRIRETHHQLGRQTVGPSPADVGELVEVLEVSLAGVKQAVDDDEGPLDIGNGRDLEGGARARHEPNPMTRDHLCLRQVPLVMSHVGRLPSRVTVRSRDVHPRQVDAPDRGTELESGRRVAEHRRRMGDLEHRPGTDAMSVLRTELLPECAAHVGAVSHAMPVARPHLRGDRPVALTQGKRLTAKPRSEQVWIQVRVDRHGPSLARKPPSLQARVELLWTKQPTVPDWTSVPCTYRPKDR